MKPLLEIVDLTASVEEKPILKGINLTVAPGEVHAIMGPNGSGKSNITDAIRCLKLGLDRGLSGTLVAASSYFMKSPPIQIADDIARERVEAFIRGEDDETLDGSLAENPTAIRSSRQAAKAPARAAKPAAKAEGKSATRAAKASPAE